MPPLDRIKTPNRWCHAGRPASVPQSRAALRSEKRTGKPVERGVETLTRDVERSADLLCVRRQNVPEVRFDAALPVSARRGNRRAIRDHQVVIVCGETGSGKSTQTPQDLPGTRPRGRG